MKKRKILVVILAVIAIVSVTSFILQVACHKRTVEETFRHTVEEAHTMTLEYLQTEDENTYSEITAKFYSLLTLTETSRDKSKLRTLYISINDTCSYLTYAPAAAKLHLEFLDDALIRYVNTGNISGLTCDLVTFNNRVHEDALKEANR